jgi:hypothetical protein
MEHFDNLPFPAPINVAAASQTIKGYSVQVKVSAYNWAFGNAVGGLPKLNVMLLIRFTDHSYFGPLKVFDEVDVKQSATLNLAFPALKPEELFVFWQEQIGGQTLSRVASVSVLAANAPNQLTLIQMGWGGMILNSNGVTYERSVASMS